jgi:16S rRNA (uracil1498-N3)-methyltransferase
MRAREAKAETAHDRAPRLHVDEALGEGRDVALDGPQAHYLRNVLRLREGDAVRLFNGRDGEWRAALSQLGRKGGAACCAQHLRDQQALPDIHCLFAPLKHARLDYMVQKATEMGVAVLQPVTSDYTNAGRLNVARMRANAIEAAEQCNLMGVPEIRALDRLETVLAAWPGDRRLVYCDEAAAIASPLEALARLEPGPLAVLIGPEGGFSPREREFLRAQPYVCPVSLGPRIMRADTAAVAALALVQAVLGDWR